MTTCRRRPDVAGVLGPWHALLTVAVAASLLAPAGFDFPSLMWVGALGRPAAPRPAI